MDDYTISPILEVNEDEAVIQLKSIVYHGFISQNTETIVSKIPKDRQRLVFEAVINSTSFEQRLRRDYVVSQLVGNTQLLDPKLADSLMFYLSNPSSESPDYAELNKLVRSDQVTQLPEELKTQIQAYVSADKGLTQLTAYLIKKELVDRYYELIKDIKATDRQVLSKSIDSYFATCQKLGLDVIIQNPTLPLPIIELLGRTPVGVVLGKLETAGEKLKFLAFIKRAIVALEANDQETQKLDDEAIKTSIAQVMAVQGMSPFSDESFTT